jgi:hypothetical protein
VFQVTADELQALREMAEKATEGQGMDVEEFLTAVPKLLDEVERLQMLIKESMMMLGAYVTGAEAVHRRNGTYPNVLVEITREHVEALAARVERALEGK